MDKPAYGCQYGFMIGIMIGREKNTSAFEKIEYINLPVLPVNWFNGEGQKQIIKKKKGVAFTICSQRQLCDKYIF